jgi:glycosyltransferase involved in cell wall biosynthesis
MFDFDLTIITVTKNDSQGLRRTLESLRKIIKIKWNILVVDGSPEKLFPFEEFRDLPIRVLNDKSMGIYAAMNYGIKEAKGETIWFLNGGDELFDEYCLIEMIETCKNKSLAIAVSGVNLIRKDYSIKIKYPHAKFRAALLFLNKVNHQCTVYNSRVFKKIGPFSTAFKIAGDYDHHIRCYTSGVVYLTTNKILSNFYTDGISSVRPLKARFNDLGVIFSNRKNFPSKNIFFLFVACWGVSFVKLNFYLALKALIPEKIWLSLRHLKEICRRGGTIR